MTYFTGATVERIVAFAVPMNAGAELVPVGVTVCVCVPSALPVKIGATTVAFAAVAASALGAVLTTLLPALTVIVLAALVPAGVPALTAELVFELPVKVGAATEPAGVTLASGGVEPDIAEPSELPIVPLLGLPAA